MAFDILDIKVARIHRFDDEKPLKAFVDISINDVILVKGIKLVEGRKGLFVSMPSRRRTDGTFRDIVHPLNARMREMIEKAIIAEYEKVKDQGGSLPNHDEGQ